MLEAVSQWAERHFGQARLRHKRRTRRLVRVALALALKPGASLRQALPARADYDAALRLFRTSMANHSNVIRSHCDLVHQQALQPGHYFFIQDKTELDYTGREVRGLGPIGDHNGQGIHAQTTLCVEIDPHSPQPRPRRIVGVAHQSLWTRDPDKPAKSQGEENWRGRLQRPRESEHWGEAFAQLSASPAPGVRWTYVADRESDLTPILDGSRLPENGDFIVRLFRERVLSQESPSGHRLLSEAVEGASEPGRDVGRCEVKARPARAPGEASGSLGEGGTGGGCGQAVVARATAGSRCSG